MPATAGIQPLTSKDIPWTAITPYHLAFVTAVSCALWLSRWPSKQARIVDVQRYRNVRQVSARLTSPVRMRLRLRLHVQVESAFLLKTRAAQELRNAKANITLTAMMQNNTQLRPATLIDLSL